MKKVKAELAKVVGANKKLQESDIDNLPYFQAIMEETLHLHPPAPILLPRKASQDTNFNGIIFRKIPKFWSIAGQLEEIKIIGIWEDALSFKPERFLNSNINSKDQNYELLPFGTGRRIYPGIPLAHGMVPLVLGSLLHHFEWELCDGRKRIDMTETIGAPATKQELLRVIPKRKTP